MVNFSGLISIEINWLKARFDSILVTQINYLTRDYYKQKINTTSKHLLS